MAKGARASKVKSNNQKLKSKVFGPIETARTERLSAKLLELASQPRPSKGDPEDVVMDADPVIGEDTRSVLAKGIRTDEMVLDQAVSKPLVKAKTSKVRVQKRRSSRSKASIIFPKYKDRVKGKR